MGGGVTASAEFNLFGTIASEASVSVEAEHEWEETKTYTRDAKVYIPSNSWGFVWVAPTVGRITGTLLAKIGPATFTATNFTQERSGVSGPTDPRTQPIPAYNVVTKTRPMTAAETDQVSAAGCLARRWRRGRALKAKAPGPAGPRSLGRPRGAGGHPGGRAAAAGLAGREAVRAEALQGDAELHRGPGLGGTWNYKKRKLSVVFGPDRRVAAVITPATGARRTAWARTPPWPTCAASSRVSRARSSGSRIDCTVKRVSGPRTVEDGVPPHHRPRRQAMEAAKVHIYVDGVRGEHMSSRQRHSLLGRRLGRSRSPGRAGRHGGRAERGPGRLTRAKR